MRAYEGISVYLINKKKSQRTQRPLPILSQNLCPPPRRGERERARSPLVPRHPRGCRGAERPTPASSGTKINTRMSPASSETNPSKEQPRESARGRVALSYPVTRGGVEEQSAPRPRRREPKSTPECLLLRRKQILQKNSPGRVREGVNPLVPRHPRGCRGAERPTPASSETKINKRMSPASSETNIPTRTAPGELERV